MDFGSIAVTQSGFASSLALLLRTTACTVCALSVVDVDVVKRGDESLRGIRCVVVGPITDDVVDKAGDAALLL